MKKKYLEYDYEGMFSNSTSMLDEWMVEQILKQPHKCVYATKEYKLKDQLEIEIYPEFSNKKDVIEHSVRKNKKAQKNLNDKNSRKYLRRLVEKNFDTGDIWATLTYDDEHLPKNMEEAKKNIANYIKSINYRLKKMGCPNAKYVYITEYSETSKIRYHHHLIIKCELTMDELEKKWKHGRRNETRRVDRDENGIIGLSKYISKTREKGKHEKRWSSSINLEKVSPRKNHYKFKKKKVDEMIKDNDCIQTHMEQTYPDYIFTNANCYYNDFNAKWYIQARMRKRVRC